MALSDEERYRIYAEVAAEKRIYEAALTHLRPLAQKMNEGRNHLIQLQSSVQEKKLYQDELEGLRRDLTSILERLNAIRDDVQRKVDAH